MKKGKVFWIVVILVLILDRITKELAPGLPAEGLALIPGVIGLRYTENTGIAFSLLDRDRDGAIRLSKALEKAMSSCCPRCGRTRPCRISEYPAEAWLMDDKSGDTP